MMDWMKNYGDTKAKLSEDQIQAIYREELQKIKVVRDSMLTSIERANKWLKELPAG
jgi:hypothetical protein